MSKIVKSIDELVGNTPLFRVNNYGNDKNSILKNDKQIIMGFILYFIINQTLGIKFQK